MKSQNIRNDNPESTLDIPHLGFVTACSKTAILCRYLLSSPCIAQNRYPLRIATGVDSAAEVFNAVLDAPRIAKWLVWVHQDVFLPTGWDDLFSSALTEAEQRFGHVDVAGVYGFGQNRGESFRAGRVWDRGQWLDEPGPLPCRAESLDELLFAVRSDSPLRLDPNLGFDFYATDLVMSASEADRTSIIVDAPCEHHSLTPRINPPEATLDRIEASGRHFLAKWGHRLPISTPCFDLQSREDFFRILEWHRAQGKGA